MRLAITTLILLAVLATTTVAEQVKLARVTVYWASGGKGSDRYTRLHKCATGQRLHEGHCAVDPNHIPYGSKVVLPDGSVLAAVDTGSAVRNRKAARKIGRTASERSAIVIDRFFETKRQALAWAQTHPLFQTVRVITPGTQAPTRQFFPTNLVVRKAVAVNVRANSTTTSTTGQQQPANRYAIADTMMHSNLNRLGR